MKNFLALIILTLTTTAQAKRIDIWNSVPFVRGADICEYQNTYGQTRNEYMREMVSLATQLMDAGALGFEALDLLKEFDLMYDKNKALAIRGKHIDVTLESTLKAFMSDLYRKIQPNEEKVSFKNLGKLRRIINQLKRGKLPDDFEDSDLEELDFVAYGSYSFSPNCNGDILVTIHLIGKDDRIVSYQSTGKLSNVMKKIAQDIIWDFQTNDFPSTITIGNRKVTILGSLSGNIGVVNRVTRAKQACDLMGGRLPNQIELEMIDLVGDFNGGVSIGRKVWALSGNRVYHPLLQNPSPVRRESEVNTRKFHYYCIQ